MNLVDSILPSPQPEMDTTAQEFGLESRFPIECEEPAFRDGTL